MDQQSAPSDKLDILSILNSADTAHAAGKRRLAAHLYRAAFEMECSNTVGEYQPSERVLKGMHHAWQIALDEKDRSDAEAVLNDLMPYNNAAETQKAVASLQELAITQLGDVGVSRIDLEGMARSVGEAIGLPAAGDKQRLTFQRLAGYDSVLAQAREYGFLGAGDNQFKQFAEQAAAFHGIECQVMADTFMIHGTSRDDVDYFAKATATELGAPVLALVVDVDENCNGSIRMTGPFRRSHFGTPDLSDIPLPCTLVISGIDQLQKLMQRDYSEFDEGNMSYQGRMIQQEIMGLLSGLIRRGEVRVIATSCSATPISEPLASLFGECAVIEIAQPNLAERFEVLKCFADEHPSFRELDLQRLSHLSAGASRHELITACRQALESAYRHSLKNSRQSFVSFEDLLVNLSAVVGQDSLHHQDLEEEAVAMFRRDIEGLERELGDL